MSCIDAPIFGPDGGLAAALDVSSARADDSEGSTKLISAMITRLLSRSKPTSSVMPTQGGGSCRWTTPMPRLRLWRWIRMSWWLCDPCCTAGVLVWRWAMAASCPLAGSVRPRPAWAAGAERAAIVQALTRNGGNASAAARELEMGRATLYRRMKRLGILESDRDLSHH